MQKFLFGPVGNITIYIARVVSAYLVVTGLGFLISADYFSAMVATTGSDPVLINLSGMTHFFIGATILVLHFRWKKLLEIMASLMGIFYLMKGVSLIAIPALTLQTGNNEAQATLIGPAIGFLVFGLVMGILAWRARLNTAPDA